MLNGRRNLEVKKKVHVKGSLIEDLNLKES